MKPDFGPCWCHSWFTKHPRSIPVTSVLYQCNVRRITVLLCRILSLSRFTSAHLARPSAQNCLKFPAQMKSSISFPSISDSEGQLDFEIGKFIGVWTPSPEPPLSLPLSPLFNRTARTTRKIPRKSALVQRSFHIYFRHRKTSFDIKTTPHQSPKTPSPSHNLKMSSETPSFSSLPLKKDGPRGNAWDLYGPKDELGMLNRLTPSTTLSATKEIVHGIRVATDWPLNALKTPCFDRQPFHQHIKHKEPRTVNDDILTFNTQSSSQWDGFRHFGE